MKSKFPTIIGVFILIAGVAVGVFMLQQQTIFKLGASPDEIPKDVKTTNIGDNSLTVTWVTDKETVGYVQWGESASNPSTPAHEEGSAAKNIHSVTIRNLSASKTYYFKIFSAGTPYDDNGSPWSAQTGPKLSTPSGASVISGTIFKADGEPASNVLVYANIPGGAELSALTSVSGKWLISLSTARTSSLTSYASVGSETLIDLFVQGGPLGIATAQIFPEAANPAPDITLGKVHDFRSQPAENDNQESPEFELTLPDDNDQSQSRFDASDDATGEGDISSVTLESIREGEVVYTTQPEFFGEGPQGATITVTVESDPITEEIDIPDDGTWAWSPPANLEEGEHKVTINWRDATGVLRTLTRNFVVMAAEDEPAFESTPSATPKVTPSPKPSPTSSATPTASPKPVKTATPSATPRVSIPATESALPEPGTKAPTIALLMFGFLLLGSCVAIVRKS